jgi:hypothetical protein
MGRILDFFTGRVAPEPEPTAVPTTLSTAGSTTLPTAGSTAGPTAQPTTETDDVTHDETYIIRDGGVIVGLGRETDGVPNPTSHALALLQLLMQDEGYAGQPATEKHIRDCYTGVCRIQGAKPLPWLSVVRPFNALLKLIYGPAYRKTYKRFYERGRPRQRRIYRIPLLSEFETATRALEARDVARVA